MGTYFDSNKQKSVNAYIKAAKGRKIVMSSGDVIVDPSSLWLCRNGVVYGRVYVKFRVKHGNIPSAKSELQNEVIYGNYTAVKNLSSKKTITYANEIYREMYFENFIQNDKMIKYLFDQDIVITVKFFNE